MGKRSRNRGGKGPKPRKQKEQFAFRKIGFSSYVDYLASPLWEAIRQRVLLRDKHKCCCCDQPASQVHHCSYAMSVMDGKLDELLISVCKACHFAIEYVSVGEKRQANKCLKRTYCLLELANRNDVVRRIKQGFAILNKPKPRNRTPCARPLSCYSQRKPKEIPTTPPARIPVVQWKKTV